MSQVAKQKAYARALIRSSKGLTRATQRTSLVKSASASAFCNGGVGEPEPGCTLYNPPAEPGFPGSIISMKGGTQLVDPSTCSGATTTVPPDHFLNGHLDTSLGCPEDGDVVMWRAGTGTKPGRWVSAHLEEVFARACFELPDTLGAEDCAAAIEAATPKSAGCDSTSSSTVVRSTARSVASARSSTRSSAISRSSTAAESQFYGSGIDGDLLLDSDSQLTSDMYWENLNLNGFTLFTNGYRVFVNGYLNAGRHHSTGQPGKISNNGQAGSKNGVGEGGKAGTLGKGAAGGWSLDYSIALSGGSNAEGEIVLKPLGVPESEGGDGLLQDLSSALRMRALDGNKLNGGAGGAGLHAGGGGGVVFVAARQTLIGGRIEALGGAAGASDSGAGGGGAIVFIHSDYNSWTLDVSGGDAVAEKGRIYDIQL